jgi:hypothetical protein
MIIYVELIIGSIFLTCGCAIYLLFRSKSLNIYRWCSQMGFSDYIDSVRLLVQNWNIPPFIKFCLPDGLYCAAYLLVIDAIWHNEDSLIKYIIMSLVPLVTISSELLQYFGLIRGTFDLYDLICYSIPILVYSIMKYFTKTNNK